MVGCNYYFLLLIHREWNVFKNMRGEIFFSSSIVSGLPLGPNQESEGQQMVRETNSAAVPGLWWSVMWGFAAHSSPDYTPLTQRGNYLPPPQGRLQDVWLHRCTWGRGLLTESLECWQMVPIYRHMYMYFNFCSMTSPVVL